jgi:hypothetical protein
MKIIGQIHCQNENLSKITSILPKAQPITILSIVVGLESVRVILERPDGEMLSVPMNAIVRWELPTASSALSPVEEEPDLDDAHEDLTLGVTTASPRLPTPAPALASPSTSSSDLRAGDRCTYYGTEHRGIGGIQDLLVMEVQHGYALVKNRLWLFDPLWMPVNELGKISTEKKKDRSKKRSVETDEVNDSSLEELKWL